jgi:hypothetical protein
LKLHGVDAVGAQPTSLVPALRGSAPEASAVKVNSPYGWTNVYCRPGHRPEVTFIRSRLNTICSPATGEPETKVCSVAARKPALPAGEAAPQPGVLITSESRA